MVSLASCRTKLESLMSTERVMSEFDELQPVFLCNDDDKPPSSPDYCASLSEEIWKKFELLPTPPRSPEHDGSADAAAATTTTPPAPHFDPVYTTRHFSAAGDGFDNRVGLADSDLYGSYNLIKDCMWNGVGHKPHAARAGDGKRPRNASPSPGAFQPAVNGCVDPRAVFACRSTSSKRDVVTTTTKSSNAVVDGNSDSDEEIDVVTVDKKKAAAATANNSKSQQTTTTLGVVSQGHRYVGTLVSRQNGRHRQFALVTTAGNNRLRRSADAGDAASAVTTQAAGATTAPVAASKFKLTTSTQQVGGAKPRCVSGGRQAVTMLVNELKTVAAASKNRATVNLQIKSLPLLTAAGGVARKRRLHGATTITTTPSGAGDNMQQIVRLTSAAAASSAAGAEPTAESKENNSPAGFRPATASPAGGDGKRRLLSLDGVSMVSNTGVLRHRAELSNRLNAITDLSDHRLLSSCDSRKFKTTKRPVINFDSPTSSPGSSVDDPVLQAKRSRGGGDGSSGDSSANEEVRAAHNVLERQRREGLRTSFHALRRVVPDLVTLEKAPKVTILKQATNYAVHLQQESCKLEQRKTELKLRQIALQQRLRDLASELSSVGSAPAVFAAAAADSQPTMLMPDELDVKHEETVTSYFACSGDDTYDDDDSDDYGDFDVTNAYVKPERMDDVGFSPLAAALF